MMLVGLSYLGSIRLRKFSSVTSLQKDSCQEWWWFFFLMPFLHIWDACFFHFQFVDDKLNLVAVYYSVYTLLDLIC